MACHDDGHPTDGNHIVMWLRVQNKFLTPTSDDTSSLLANKVGSVITM